MSAEDELYAQQLEDYARPILASLYAIIPLTFLAIGLQVFMCWFGAIVYHETAGSAKKGRLIYLALSWVLLILFTISQVTDAVAIFNMLANSDDSWEALSVVKPRDDMHWWRIFTAMSLWMCNWIGDCMLLYRCYMIWNDMPWICLIPGLPWIGACVMSIVTMIYRVKALHGTPDYNNAQSNKFLQAWIFMSVGINCIITGLIAYRLLRVRQQLSTALARRDLRIYIGIVGILVESALPLTAAGLLFAIFSSPWAVNSQNPQMHVARTVILTIWFCLTVIAPQMIIFRVTTGRSWIHSPTTREGEGGGMSAALDFVDPNFMSTKGDHEISTPDRETSNYQISTPLA